LTKKLFRYRVIIPYREPTFALHKGFSPEEVYYAAFNVVAENKTAAIDRGLDIFEKDAKNSSVRWRRIPQVSGIKVEQLKSDDEEFLWKFF
jgi:hypothetical protein